MALRHAILAIGVSRHEITGMLNTGFLIGDGNGAYRLAGAVRTGPAAAKSALGASGGLALALGTAMDWEGVRLRWLPPDPRHVHVLIDAAARVQSTDWYSVHPTRRLDIDDETTFRHGVRATTVARCMRDFAAFLPYSDASTRQLDAWVDEARAVNKLQVWQLAEAAERERSRKVSKRLKDLHTRHVGVSPAEFKSIGEEWLRDLIKRKGLPQPLWNVKPPFAAKEVDAFYPDVPLIIEFDGYWVHRPRGKHHRDRAGDRRALVEGRVPTLRVTKWDFDHDLPQLERDIEELVLGPPLLQRRAA